MWPLFLYVRIHETDKLDVTFASHYLELCSKNIMFAEHNYWKLWNLLTVKLKPLV